jgi:PhzF family phenazine biosynthesis protein
VDIVLKSVILFSRKRKGQKFLLKTLFIYQTMTITMYQVDAFTDKLFGGNPAAICPLDEWIDDELMQKIALENNLSETAFFVPKGDVFDIRWFTPKAEINLAGHPTLASAYVIFEILNYEKQVIEFHSKSGSLYVEKKDDVYWMDFPSKKPEKIKITKDVIEAIGMIPCALYKNRDYIAVYERKEEVENVMPDFDKIKNLAAHGLIVTSKDGSVDFVSRFFAPAIGINEDPVTGSAHTQLIPLWAEKLKKNQLTAHQISERGGLLFCESNGERVKIGGKAVLYMKGEIYV